MYSRFTLKWNAVPDINLPNTNSPISERRIIKKYDIPCKSSACKFL